MRVRVAHASARHVAHGAEGHLDRAQQPLVLLGQAAAHHVALAWELLVQRRALAAGRVPADGREAPVLGDALLHPEKRRCEYGVRGGRFQMWFGGGLSPASS